MHRRGLSIVECAMVMALLVCLASMTLGPSITAFARRNTEVEFDSLLVDILNTRRDALNNLYGTAQGIHVEPTFYVRFRGVYDPASSENIVRKLPKGYTLISSSDLVFSPVTAHLATSTTIIIRNEITHEEKNIIISPNATITW